MTYKGLHLFFTFIASWSSDRHPSLTYAAVYALYTMIQELEIPMCKNFERSIKLLFPDVNLPNKISDLTSKVKKKIESTSLTELNDVICQKIQRNPSLPGHFIGSNCEKKNITKVYLDQCEEGFDLDPVGHLTQQEVFELFQYRKKQNKTWQHVSLWLKNIYHLDDIPNRGSVCTSFTKIVRERAKISKNNVASIEAHKIKKYTLPVQVPVENQKSSHVADQTPALNIKKSCQATSTPDKKQAMLIEKLQNKISTCDKKFQNLILD